MSISPTYKKEEVRASGKLLKNTLLAVKKIKQLPEGSVLNLVFFFSFLVTWIAVLLGRDIPVTWSFLLFMLIFAIYFKPLINRYGRGGSES